MSLVELQRFSDAAQAHILRGRLEAAGIKSFCFDTGMNMAEGVPMLFKVQLMVLADELEEARSIIAQGVDQAAYIPVEDQDYDDEPFRHMEEDRDRRKRLLGWLLISIAFGPALLLGLARCAA